MSESKESLKKITREMNQIKVENQWLIRNSKETSLNEVKVEDLERELEYMRKDLKDEREKVKYFLY